MKQELARGLLFLYRRLIAVALKSLNSSKLLRLRIPTVALVQTTPVTSWRVFANRCFPVFRHPSPGILTHANFGWLVEYWVLPKWFFPMVGFWVYIQYPWLTTWVLVRVSYFCGTIKVPVPTLHLARSRQFFVRRFQLTCLPKVGVKAFRIFNKYYYLIRSTLVWRVFVNLITTYHDFFTKGNSWGRISVTKQHIRPNLTSEYPTQNIPKHGRVLGWVYPCTYPRPHGWLGF